MSTELPAPSQAEIAAAGLGQESRRRPLTDEEVEFVLEHEREYGSKPAAPLVPDAPVAARRRAMKVAQAREDHDQDEHDRAILSGQIIVVGRAPRCQSRARRASRGKAIRRRGSRRVGAGSRAGPDDPDGDLDPPGLTGTPPAKRDTAGAGR